MIRWLSVALVWLMISTVQATAAGIPADVQQMLATQERVAVIVKLKGAADVSTFGVMTLHEKRRAMVGRLKAVAAADREQLLADVPLQKRAAVKSLWHINSLALEAGSAELAALAVHPLVENIRLDAVVHRTLTPLASPSSVQWNITATKAPDLWDLNIDGSGVVVASLDTGVDYLHEDLNSRWRGGTNSWFNPYANACQLSGTCGVCDENDATPCDYVDAYGVAHGTGVMSLMVAGDATGSSLGVAPGAQWIAAKIFKEDDTATLSAIHEAFGWMLDPDGNPSTDDMPDVVNNSWGIDGIDECDNTFLTDLQRLETAGISVVFSAGNDGPTTPSSVSPANNGIGLAVGSIDSANVISDFSARGPSACSGDETIFPDLVAPGESVRVADYTVGGTDTTAYLDGLSGTSFSSPHVAGVIALLRQAYPSASVATLESALLTSATDLGATGADNVYGHGAVNALAAYQYLAGQPYLSVIDSVSPQNDLSLPFGSVVPGSEATAEVILSNVGTADLIITSVGSGLAAPFFVEDDQCSGATLAETASCTFSVRFAPTAVGTTTADLSIVSNAGSSVLRLSGAGNNLPLPAELLSPADGASLTGSSVKFSWNPGSDPDGGSVTSALLVSTRADFIGADRYEVAAVALPQKVALASLGGGALFLVPLLGLALFHKRSGLLVLGLAFLLLLGSCGGGGGGGGGDDTSTVKSVQVDGLSSDTYYWKVVTTDSLNGSTDSEVRTFTIQ